MTTMLGTPEVKSSYGPEAQPSIAAKTPSYRSVSQRNTYERCPHAYYLGRIEKVWQRPAAWLPMGSAVHYAVEMYEKSRRTLSVEEAQDAFRESYVEEVDKYTRITPNFAWWTASGPYKAVDDIPRRYDLSLDHVKRYIEWAETHPDEKVWSAPDGELASELGFNVEFGDVSVRGFIDLVVMQDRKTGPEIVVRDVKTGNTPGDDFQLGVYARAVELTYSLPEGLIEAGDYFMTKTGKPTFPYDLTYWTNQRVADEFGKLEEGISAGDFPAKPSPDKCKFCDVSLSCDFRQA